MLRTRIIPALLLRDDALVKTTQFKNPRYIGDPINTVRIFNELEVDELTFLDITATNESRNINLQFLSEIADECFMPLSYGGGLSDFDSVKSIFKIGFEKVVLNSVCFKQPDFVTRVAEHFGSQAVIASIDVKKNFWGNYEVWSNSGTINTKKNPVDWALEIEKLGAGEILLTSIDKEGTWSGFDCSLIKKVSEAVNIPVIAHGGAGSPSDISEIIKKDIASAVAIGSMVVYQKKGMGVLVNFPDRFELDNL
jgi:imidazole glycerol-phosphate synthase subunit HisF